MENQDYYEYKKERHLEVLKYMKQFGSLRTYFDDKDYSIYLTSEFRGTREDYFEKAKYSIMVISHLHWENRRHYYQLMVGLILAN